MPVAAPKTNSATQSAGTEYTSPGSRAAAETAIAAAALTGPGPNRAHQPPVKRMQTRAPRERQSRATPSVLCPAPTRTATSGTRAAQLPKTAPSRTNSAVTAARRRPTEGAGTRVPADRTRTAIGRRARGSTEGTDMVEPSRARTEATHVVESWAEGEEHTTSGTRTPRCHP